MDARRVAAVIAIGVPIVFNVAFFELGRAFDYPSILPPPLTRSCAGSRPADRSFCVGTCYS